VAIGLEGIVTANYVLTAVFVPLGMFVSLMPIKIRTDRCIACQTPLSPGQAICPTCGAPQM
jgi:predicted amidophosphoribosyltransferase